MDMFNHFHGPKFCQITGEAMAARGPRLQGILQVDGLHIRRRAAHVDAPPGPSTAAYGGAAPRWLNVG